jgi:hypothetical protein
VIKVHEKKLCVVSPSVSCLLVDLEFNISFILYLLTCLLIGLSVLIFLDQINYMLNKLSKQAGAKLFVHDSGILPLPDEYGIDLQPNTANSVAV